MRRVIQSGVVLGVLAALAAAPVVADALPRPAAPQTEPQATAPQFLPNFVPPSQREQQNASAADRGGAADG